MESYRHRQPATAIWLAMGLTTALIAVIAGSLSLLAPSEERAAVVWVLLLVVGIMVLFGWLFGGLTVSLNETEIDVRFGPGWPRKSIALAQVCGAEPVRNSWWYGWGIRITPHGWLWNVSGLDAVEVKLADRRRFRIGTDEPQALAAAIHRAIGT